MSIASVYNYEVHTISVNEKQKTFTSAFQGSYRNQQQAVIEVNKFKNSGLNAIYVFNASFDRYTEDQVKAIYDKFNKNSILQN